MTCPVCNYELADHKAVCDCCGNFMEATHCTYCGLREDPKSDFCLGCGLRKNFRINETGIGTCRNCGILWRNTWFYCRLCGVARENGLIASSLPVVLPMHSLPEYVATTVQRNSYESQQPRLTEISGKSAEDTAVDEEFPSHFLTENEVVERMFGSEEQPEADDYLSEETNRFSELRESPQFLEEPSSEINPDCSSASVSKPEEIFDLSEDLKPIEPVSEEAIEFEEAVPLDGVSAAETEEKTKIESLDAATEFSDNSHKHPVQAVKVLNQRRTAWLPFDKNLIQAFAILFLLILLFVILWISGYRISDFFGSANHSNSL